MTKEILQELCGTDTHLQMNIKNYEEEQVAKFLQRFRKRFRTMKCDKFKKWLNHV